MQEAQGRLHGVWSAWRRTAFRAPDSARAAIWCPIAFAAGAALYFGLPAEPAQTWLWIAFAAAVAAFLAALKFAARARLWLCLLMIAAALAGFARAHHRTLSVEGAVVPDSARAREVTGWLEAVQTSGGRERLVIRVTRLEGIASPPKRVRMTARRGALSPGDGVRVRAVLGPPPRPAAPGAYDSGFAAWFSGLGATGYAISTVEPHRAASERDRLARSLARWRWTLAERIRAQSPPRTGGIAAALLTGDRSGITPEAAEALRATGLGHILAISGLHMALFAGGVFFAVRALFAAIEPYARRHDPGRPAAAAALAAAVLYLIVSGGAIPTQRAFIMAAAVLTGVLLGRRALSMRTVAFAAFAVLALQPEAIVTPGFQMSFAAAAALIAAFELARARDRGPRGQPGWFGRGRTFFGAIFFSSLVAGLATGAYSAFHFNRIAAFGLAANLAAMPVFSLAVMPAGAVALILMPLGLEGPALAVMNAGLEAVLRIAEPIAAWPGALAPAPAGPGPLIALYGAGYAALVAGRGASRVGGAAILVLAMALWASAPRPDILITDAAVVIARFGEEGGSWEVSDSRRSRFAARVFMERAGSREPPVRAGIACDGAGCAGRASGLLIALPQGPEALREDCARAALVVTRALIDPERRADCRARLIDGVLLDRDGAMALWVRDGRIVRTLSVARERGDRPWTAR